MKNHEKIDAENGNGKGPKTSKNTKNYFPKWDAGGVARNACILHSTLPST